MFKCITKKHTHTHTTSVEFFCLADRQQILRKSQTLIISNWIYTPFPLLCCVSAECLSLCARTTWWRFWSVSQKGSDSLILLHIYKSEIHLCFLFPAFCSVNFHMPHYFPLRACWCVSVCGRIGRKKKNQNKIHDVWHDAFISMEIGCRRVPRNEMGLFRGPLRKPVEIYQLTVW